MAYEKISILKDGRMWYQYSMDELDDDYQMDELDDDYHFSFSTLAEVGAPYQQAFRNIIAQAGFIVEYNREIVKAPWVADYVVSNSNKNINWP